MGLFSSRGATARREYRKFVREGIGQKSPWGKVQGQVLLGEEGFVERIKGLLGDRREVREIPRSQRYINRPALDQIFSDQQEKEGRNIAIRIAHLSYGYTLREIADYLGIHYTTVSKVKG